MIGAVLATDMALHFSKIGVFKGKVESEELDATNFEDKKFICEQIFHLSDISNVAKPFHLAENWANLLFNEFFLQGDQEKRLGHNVSQFMDRCTTNVASSQAGFIDFIIKPSFAIIQILLPKAKVYLDQIDSNKMDWEKKIPEYERKMEDNKHSWEA